MSLVLNAVILAASFFLGGFVALEPYVNASADAVSAKLVM
jgi:hypothetical protein